MISFKAVAQWLEERTDALFSDLSARAIQHCKVTIGENSAGSYAVVGNFVDERPGVCLHAAAACMDILGRGHRMIIRNPPEEERFRDFEKSTVFWEGYVRFYVFDEEGNWDERSVLNEEPGSNFIRFLSFHRDGR